MLQQNAKGMDQWLNSFALPTADKKAITETLQRSQLPRQPQQKPRDLKQQIEELLKEAPAVQTDKPSAANKKTTTKVGTKSSNRTSAVTRNLTAEPAAQGVYWSDQLDRWAEILVGPG